MMKNTMRKFTRGAFEFFAAMAIGMTVVVVLGLLGITMATGCSSDNKPAGADKPMSVEAMSAATKIASQSGEYDRFVQAMYKRGECRLAQGARKFVEDPEQYEYTPMPPKYIGADGRVQHSRLEKWDELALKAGCSQGIYCNGHVLPVGSVCPKEDAHAEFLEQRAAEAQVAMNWEDQLVVALEKYNTCGSRLATKDACTNPMSVGIATPQDKPVKFTIVGGMGKDVGVILIHAAPRDSMGKVLMLRSPNQFGVSGNYINENHLVDDYQVGRAYMATLDLGGLIFSPPYAGKLYLETTADVQEFWISTLAGVE